MKRKERLMFLIAVLICQSVHPSSCPAAEVLPLVHSQGNTTDNPAANHEHFNNGSNNHSASDAAIAHQHKVSAGGHAGGHPGGGHPSETNNGGGGGTDVPYAHGGVIPLYAAAGAGHGSHNRHHNGGSHGKSRGLAALAITTFLWFVLCIHKEL